MNQIIAAIMLFGIITIVFAPIIIESGSQIFSKSTSISDSMESSRLQAGQLIVVTHIQQDENTVIYLSNIGTEDVRIHAVLIDGIETLFSLSNQNSMPIDVFSTGELGILNIVGTGDAVQIVTNSGKLFEFLAR